MGGPSFAVLMAQDLWIVPVMAMVPILAHTTAQTATIPLWEKARAGGTGVLAGIIVVGRYLLAGRAGLLCEPAPQMDAFGVVLFLAVIAAAWAVDHVGISMTLGAFLLGMLLSASDFRYQIEATVAPFKQTLMGLFFIAVGMSIDVGALQRDWAALLVHVPVVSDPQGRGVDRARPRIRHQPLGRHPNGILFVPGGRIRVCAPGRGGRCRFAERRGAHVGYAAGCRQHDFDPAAGESG